MKLLKTYNSDDNLFKVFTHASKVNGNLKILRFAAPHGFRQQIISLINPIDFNYSENDFVKMLKSPRIKKIEILLINPFSDSYLKKLDAEKKSNYDIVRIRNQMIEFVKGLVSLSKIKRNIFIGLHSNYCIWNLGIVESGKNLSVNVKSYGSSSQYIGHDNDIEEFVLESGRRTQLAEGFLNYFNSLKNDRSTIWITNSEELNRVIFRTTYPSLFKGNVVLEPDDSDLPFSTVSKMCLRPNSTDAEFQYYKLDISHRESYKYFTLPSISTKPQVEKEWIGKLNNIEYIQGLRIFDVTSMMHRNFHNATDDLANKAKELIFFFLDHSLNALKEFRTIDSNKDFSINAKKYPYDYHLIDAFDEIIFLLSQYSSDDLIKVRSELKSLGRFLKQNTKYKFRDAQLKNRLLKTEKNEEELLKEIIDSDVKLLKNRYKKNILDIDFETAIFEVTEWDDICHIFLFENTGIVNIDLRKSLSKIEEQGDLIIMILGQFCNMRIDDLQKIVIWKTILARSIREYFRRLWYANIMPNSYKKRYSQEGRDYFLELALFALIQTRGFPEIQKLLNYFQETKDYFWYDIKHRKTKKILFTPADINAFFLKKTGSSRTKTVNHFKTYTIQLTEVQKVLIELREKTDVKKTFVQKANEIIILKPNFLGIGISINALIEWIFHSK